ncbi:MAG TPA: glycerol-3-phosphate 1-O-acyltransferase PlsY [Dehalococcoidales bacterium]|jgi:acyl phosphate:glycerol-3-phosphate acyltransferase
MFEALAVIVGYLLGSIPTAYIVGRLVRGVDIRQIGGGNMGALNTARELSPAWGALVLAIDIAKGAGGVLIAKALGVERVWVYLAGFAAVIGHCWPAFLKFKGGKGAATGLGVLFALAPISFACIIPLTIGVIILTSNVTLGMAVGFLFYPLFLWVFDRPVSDIIFAVLIAIFLALRYLPTALKAAKKSGGAGSFIIEKNYKPWQSKRR